MPATFKVEITPTAAADLAEIWDYNAQDSPVAATGFISTLEQQILSLAQFPERSARIPENEILSTAYRHLITGAYRTIFRINGTTVIILGVLQGARLLDTALYSKD